MVGKRKALAFYSFDKRCEQDTTHVIVSNTLVFKEGFTLGTTLKLNRQINHVSAEVRGVRRGPMFRLALLALIIYEVVATIWSFGNFLLDTVIDQLLCVELWLDAVAE